MNYTIQIKILFITYTVRHAVKEIKNKTKLKIKSKMKVKNQNEKGVQTDSEL